MVSHYSREVLTLPTAALRAENALAANEGRGLTPGRLCHVRRAIMNGQLTLTAEETGVGAKVSTFLSGFVILLHAQSEVIGLLAEASDRPRT